MKKLKSFVLALFILSLSVILLSSCNGQDDTEPEYSGDAITLNVYNWGEYISDGFEGALDVNAEFEKYYFEKFGVRVKVNYTTYATNEDMYSKLSSGAGTYDIVVPSDYMIEKMINEDMLLKFDATELENYQYIGESFKNLYYDPENCYSVPYTYGMMGVIYNEALVDEEDYSSESWGLLWNEKYRGKILQFNNPRDAFGSAMYYLGLDINSTDPAVWQAAQKKLSEQKPLIQAYVNDEIFNKMTTASAAIAPYFAGDFIIMASENEDLKFYYPEEGTNFFVDAMCIPKNAKQPEIAKEYINFMLYEEIAIANALYIGYASPHTLVSSNEDYIVEMEDMCEGAMDILYGKSPDEVNGEYNKKYGTACYKSFSPEIQEQVNSLWEGLKTENSTELWVHIFCIAIVVGVVALATYTVYIRKRRSRHYRIRDRQRAKSK